MLQGLVCRRHQCLRREYRCLQSCADSHTLTLHMLYMEGDQMQPAYSYVRCSRACTHSILTRLQLQASGQLHNTHDQ